MLKTITVGGSGCGQPVNDQCGQPESQPAVRLPQGDQAAPVG
jgi:hypothetical protein